MITGLFGIALVVVAVWIGACVAMTAAWILGLIRIEEPHKCYTLELDSDGRPVVHERI